MIDSDATYLVIQGAKSHITSHYFLAALSNLLNCNHAPHNVAILTECCTLKHIVCSAAEAECGEMFYDSQTVIGIRSMLD
eukprot:1783662-Ditylum_brightwellii.AAC.2